MRLFPKTVAGRVRLGILLLCLVAAGVYSKVQVLPYYLFYSPKEGDIIFQSLPHGDLVEAIEGATHSPYSHCGVVLQRDGQWVVAEAIISVRETPLLRWMQRGREAGVAVYRLKPEFQSNIPEFKTQTLSYLDRPYDYDFEMSDKAIYCSELIYKAFQKTTGETLGQTQKLGELDWKPFEQTIRDFQAGGLPLERVMITPEALSKADQFQLVYRIGI